MISCVPDSRACVSATSHNCTTSSGGNVMVRERSSSGSASSTMPSRPGTRTPRRSVTRSASAGSGSGLASRRGFENKQRTVMGLPVMFSRFSATSSCSSPNARMCIGVSALSSSGMAPGSKRSQGFSSCQYTKLPVWPAFQKRVRAPTRRR